FTLSRTIPAGTTTGCVPTACWATIPNPAAARSSRTWRVKSPSITSAWNDRCGNSRVQPAVSDPVTGRDRAMAARANWKGFLKVGEVSCPVALYTAASTSDRIAFHTLNRKTGNRLRRVFVDSDTGKPVDREDQVKGYEIASGEYVVLDP